VTRVLSPLKQTAVPLAAATVISQANSIVILIALTHLGAPGTLADFRVAVSVVGLATIVALPGVAIAVTRATARGHSVAYQLSRRRVPWALLAAGGLAVTGACLVAGGRQSTGVAILAAAVVFAPWSVSDLIGADLIGARDFRRYLGIQALVQICTAAWVVGTLLAIPAAAWMLVVGYFGVTSLVQGAVLVRLPRRADPEAVREAYAYGKRLSLIGVLSSIDLQLDILLAAVLLSRVDVALLAVARAGAQLFKAVWFLIAQAHVGRLAALDEHESRIAGAKLGFLVTGGFLAAGAVSAALCPTVVPLLFGSQYKEAVPVAQLLLLAPGIAGLGSALELHLKAQARVRSLWVLHTVKPLTSWVLLPTALVLFGLIGVGIEALAIAALYTMLTMWLVVRPSRSAQPSTAAGARVVGAKL
jgi:O-antigen/teichoic acid export membrane protein